MSQAALPFAARRDRSLDLGPAPETPAQARPRPGRDVVLSFTPWARELAGRWCVLYGPTPRQAVARLVELLGLKPPALRAVDLDEGAEVFADSPLEPTPRRLVALVEGLSAAEINSNLEHMESWG